MTKLTLLLHILLVVIMALLCWDVRKDNVQLILCLGSTICWIVLTVNEAIYLFG